MAGNNAIQILRSNASTIAKSNEVLLIGQPLYDTETRLLYIGNGKNSAQDLMYSAGGIMASGVRATGREARIFGPKINIYSTNEIKINAPTVRLNANLITVNSSNISLQSSNIIQIFATNSTTIGGAGDVNIGGGGNVNVSAAAGTLSFSSFGDISFNADGGTIKLPSRVSGTIALTSDVPVHTNSLNYVRIIGTTGYGHDLDLTFSFVTNNVSSTANNIVAIATAMRDAFGGAKVACTGRCKGANNDIIGAYSIYAPNTRALQFYTIGVTPNNIITSAAGTQLSITRTITPIYS